MPETITDADLRGVLDVLDAARSGDDKGGLPVAVLEQLSRLVACDSVSFNVLDTSRCQVVLDQTFPTAADSSEDTARAALPEVECEDDAFWRHYWDCLACSYPDRTGDERSITTVSDFYSQRQFQSTGMYAEYLGLFMEHEAMMCLSGADGLSRRVMFFRSTGPDFDGRDRLLLALLRPHVVEAYYDNERRRGRAAGLTRRQRELLSLVARGYSNTEIARALTISPGTVRKHLENIFERLDVTSRTAAVAVLATPAYTG